jgi:hypothetical protein
MFDVVVTNQNLFGWVINVTAIIDVGVKGLFHKK